MNTHKEIDYKKGFTIEPGQDEYVFQLRRRSYRWLWWLLLLLPLLLFVKCERTITVHTIDANSGAAVVPDSVVIDYTAHYLFSDGKFLTDEAQHRTARPDSTGTAVFSGLPCSVFSYIFYCMSEAAYDISDSCFGLPDAPEKSLFHFTRNQTLRLVPALTDIVINVTDRENADPVSGATVEYRLVRGVEERRDSVVTDAAGNCTITGVPRCGMLRVDRAACYAYRDTTDVKIDVASALTDREAATIQLTPVKESFVYFVHNLYTRRPIPDARVEIILKNRENVICHGPVSTNVDGKGRGAYGDVFIGALLELRASKQNYADSMYTPVCTVAEFISRPDDRRIIYLRPLASTQSFVNIDSASGKPIAGVMNHIKVISLDGRVYEYDEPSNRDGVFTFRALEGDNIVIDSRCEPRYESKHTEIPSFRRAEKIKMKARVTDITFRTVKAGSTALVPECILLITDSDGNEYKPRTSGSGVFTVKDVPVDTEISIVAAKTGYEDNDYTISHIGVAELVKANPSQRNIPMTPSLPPCDASSAGQKDVKAGTVSAPMSYNMGVDKGEFTISYDTGSTQSDRIDVYNHEPGESYEGKLIWTSGMVVTDGTRRASIPFSGGSVITVIVTTGPDDGSVWDYHISCP
ncbi:MAG: hypothetical protein HDR83_08505 [Bacteroides sp.]|nr:hypothetical protein [Bacteroides sp.]